MQKEIVIIVDITHCLYYVDVPDPTFRDLEMLVSLNNKAMESVKKEHMIAFYETTCLWPNTWPWISRTNIGSLQHESWSRNDDWKVTTTYVFASEQWAEGFLVQVMELVPSS